MDNATYVMTMDGVELDCEFEFDAGQAETRTDPGFPPTAYLIIARVNGVNILDLLKDGVVQSLEERAVDVHFN